MPSKLASRIAGLACVMIASGTYSEQGIAAVIDADLADVRKALESCIASLRMAIRQCLSRDLYDSDEGYKAAIEENITLMQAKAALASLAVKP